MSKRILVFGGSITRGSWDQEKCGWVNRLRLDIESVSERKYSVYNLGISGDTTEDLLKRMENECAVRHPGIIIIGIGTNDSACWDKNGSYVIPPADFSKNLRAIKRVADSFTATLIFTGLTGVEEARTSPIPFGKKIFYSNKNIEKYNQLIREFCQEHDLLFIDVLALLDKDDLADGLHPNARGHEKIFQRVKDCLIKQKII